MSKTYLPYEPEQQLLLPAALQEWLPDDHLAYFISDVVDQLDMSEVTARYERERRGGPPYHPRMMVKVLLYGYCVGVASSRRIAQRLHEDIAFRVLAANNTPDFRTISDFRKDNVDALSGLFVQVLALCQQAGLVKLGHVALDGTKVKANASKHKAMSYQRMKEKAAQLAAEVTELLRQAQAADDEEDRWYGKDKRGDELPEELAFREGRLEKIREAMGALEAEAQAAAEQAEAEGRKHPGVPDDKAQRNFTDTESRIIPAPGGKDFLQAYNCQAVVDSAHQVIVAARATNQTSDKQQAAAMMEEKAIVATGPTSVQIPFREVIRAMLELLPDDKAQRNFTDTESAKERTSSTSFHHASGRGPVRNRLRRWRRPSTTSVQSPGKYPPMLAITRQRQSTSFMLWAWTRSSRRSRPATAGLCHPRPEVAYPAICLPGTGCDGSYRPSGVGSATLCGCKLWSRYSARSSRAGDSASSCCGDWRR